MTFYSKEGPFDRILRSLVAGSMTLMMAALPFEAVAAPIGGQVVSGNAAIQQNGSTTTITQFGNKVIVNWQSFNVGAGQTVQFIQPGPLSIALNRVTGIDPFDNTRIASIERADLPCQPQRHIVRQGLAGGCGQPDGEHAVAVR